MTLVRMTEGPPEVQRAFNALVDAVRALQQMRVDPPLGLDRSGGVTKLRVAGWPPPSIRLGVTDEEIAGNSSGTVSLWRFQDEDFADTDEDLEAWNFFTSSVASGRRVLLGQGIDDGQWYVLAEDCGE